MEYRLKSGAHSYHLLNETCHCVGRAPSNVNPVSVTNTPSSNGHISGANLRRSRSLRLRGERALAKLSPRSPLAPAAFPPITENSGNIPNGELPHRQRSLSLSGVGQQPRHATRQPKVANGLATGTCSSQPRTPPASPAPDESLDDESLHSYSSVATAATVASEAAYAAHNGTTFSGRSMRYVLHCSAHAGLSGDEYLTPTQRAQRQIRRLKALLTQAKKDLEKKDSDIFRLTKEVVELRLYKASLSSPDEKSNSSDVITIKETAEDDLPTPDSPIPLESDADAAGGPDTYEVDGPICNIHKTPIHHVDMHGSFTDSGHFEDLTNSSIHSKDSTREMACGTDPVDREEERLRLISLYERKIDDMSRRHSDETQETKRCHNDKVESLLSKMAEVNSRYCELSPHYEQAKERIRELERTLEEVSGQLREQEGEHRRMYLEMYNKGVHAANLERLDQALELTHASPSRVSVPELLQQLQITQNELDNIKDTSYTPERLSPKSQILLSAKEAVSLWVLGARKAMYRRIVEAQGGSKSSIDPEVTLQFLKSAIYYFLTDPDNHQGHLNAIESILGFSDVERRNIHKARSS